MEITHTPEQLRNAIGSQAIIKGKIADAQSSLENARQFFPNRIAGIEQEIQELENQLNTIQKQIGEIQQATGANVGEITRNIIAC